MKNAAFRFLLMVVGLTAGASAAQAQVPAWTQASGFGGSGTETTRAVSAWSKLNKQ